MKFDTITYKNCAIELENTNIELIEFNKLIKSGTIIDNYLKLHLPSNSLEDISSYLIDQNKRLDILTKPELDDLIEIIKDCFTDDWIINLEFWVTDKDDQD